MGGNAGPGGVGTQRLQPVAELESESRSDDETEP